MAEVALAPSSQLVTHRSNPTKYLTITLPLRRSIYSPPSSATFPTDSHWSSKEYSRTDSDLIQKPRYLGTSYTTYSPPRTSVVDRFGREDQDRGRQNNVSPSMLLSSPSSSFITRGLPPIISPMDAPMQGYDQRPSSPRTVPSGYADASMEMGGPSDLAPRKRSKVSRACDECRRKKIRCDATSETGVEQCSSCKRVGARCSFSRVPMKRGPSKGYIKELADRLNTLENTISTSDMLPYNNLTSVEGESSPMDSEGTSPPPNLSLRQSRKRTLSSSSEFPLGMHLQPLAQSPTLQRTSERLPPIDSFHSPHHQSAPAQIPQRQLPPPHIPPSHPSSGLHSQRGSISSASVPPLIAHTSPTSGLSTSWRPDSCEARRQSLSDPLEHTDVAMSSNMMKSSGKSFDWDEPVIDQYYSIIHPTFPFLPHSKQRLRLRLSHASSRVREAVLQALYCAVRSNPASTLMPTGPFESRGVAELAFAAQYEDPSSRSIADNLIYLQTLIFLILEADNRGPAAIKGQFGPPRALWLGAAIGLAYNLRLHYGNAGSKSSDGDSDDSDEKLGRRAWWTLVVLDRWNAVSTSSPLHIPDSSVVLMQEDQSLLGIAAYQITRLSMILGHLAENLTSSDQAVSTSASGAAFVSRLLRGELERFRESVDSVLGSLNLVHIAYWHVKLLFLRLNDATEPSQLIGPATRIAVILNSGQTPITPLSYHFAALAILTLVDLLEYEETRIEAEKGVMHIAEALEKRRGVSTREDSTGWDRTIKDFISRRMSRANSGGTINAGKHPLPHGNLQHLAELAVGESAGGGGPGTSGMSSESRNPVIDAHMLQKYGYLGCLVL
ncbi:Glucose-responsive transcription factor, variant 2 [Orbilia oligospora]|uniref:Glucose-responsive transcription factor, variant 2 n=2 Tax=Orbilia oligospora TaxID=2813651 RepID=A0A6G1M0W6_ORBOL|nr:Glucose-responsive transcription factor, variant 2 [Orbilia oligospora]KAF3223047.1 Glucose-responsive transcription factor, variant 2 [Orbilia oligospora]KAF3240379.1 Glucose-responsive transcription factor, variant 2 [Orbilia oligospora]